MNNLEILEDARTIICELDLCYRVKEGLSRPNELHSAEKMAKVCDRIKGLEAKTDTARQIILTLPDSRLRTAMEYYYIYGVSYIDIAFKMGISRTSVARMLTQGRKFIKKQSAVVEVMAG